MRYKDSIQCSGAKLLEAVRKDAVALNPAGGGEFYALHIRRGDFQYKVGTLATLTWKHVLCVSAGGQVVCQRYSS